MWLFFVLSVFGVGVLVVWGAGCPPWRCSPGSVSVRCGMAGPIVGIRRSGPVVVVGVVRVFRFGEIGEVGGWVPGASCSGMSVSGAPAVPYSLAPVSGSNVFVRGFGGVGGRSGVACGKKGASCLGGAVKPYMDVAVRRKRLRIKKQFLKIIQKNLNVFGLGFFVV